MNRPTELQIQTIKKLSLRLKETIPLPLSKEEAHNVIDKYVKQMSEVKNTYEDIPTWHNSEPYK